MTGIETDYLIVGAGAAGLAFADELIEHGDEDVVIVDRRQHPGGHWNDGYPFLRLHQPSAIYGVNSQTLGSDSVDTTGSNAGFYERATAIEICDYYRNVLEERLLASGAADSSENATTWEIGRESTPSRRDCTARQQQSA